MGFEQNARLPRPNECISTRESKQTVFKGPSTSNKRAELTTKDKDYINVSKSTLLSKILSLFSRTHVSYSP